MTFRRKFARIALGTLVWLVIFEGVAWLADWKWEIHYAVTNALEIADTQYEPIGNYVLPWPDHTLRVRVPDSGGPRAEPYSLGGRVIPDAWPDGKQRFATPENLVRQGSKRVVVLGESAAFGYPYAYADVFPTKLGRALAPHGYDVINAAQIGWSSGQIVAIAERALAEFRPSVLIIYVGNNEWIRWNPYTASPQYPRDRSSLSFQRFLANSRAISAGLYLVTRWRGPWKTSAAEEVVDDDPDLEGYVYTLNHPLTGIDPDMWNASRTQYLQNYEDNLRRIVRAARARHVRVVFLTIPFNYRLSPSFWRGPQPATLRPSVASAMAEHLQRAHQSMQAQDWAAAIRDIDQALTLDDSTAITHYMRAYCLEHSGDRLAAEREYERAREQVTGHVGARTTTNRIITEIARGSGSELLDIRQMFDRYEHERGHFFNEDLIHDDCHPTPLGHTMIADALASTILGAPHRP